MDWSTKTACRGSRSEPQAGFHPRVAQIVTQFSESQQSKMWLYVIPSTVPWILGADSPVCAIKALMSQLMWGRWRPPHRSTQIWCFQLSGHTYVIIYSPSQFPISLCYILLPSINFSTSAKSKTFFMIFWLLFFIFKLKMHLLSRWSFSCGKLMLAC